MVESSKVDIRVQAPHDYLSHPQDLFVTGDACSPHRNETLPVRFEHQGIPHRGAGMHGTVDHKVDGQTDTR